MSTPRISIIIPSYNRRVILEKALRALADQTLPPDTYEVILIDDGSTDDTRHMVQNLQVPYELTYRYQDQRGPAGARNHGIRLAKADLIVFIDSDIVVTPPFLAAHEAVHETPNMIGHGAVIHTDNLDDPTAATMKITDISRAFFATGNVSIRRQHLLDVGLFDEDFVEYGWEDLEIGMRLRKLGLEATEVPGAEGFHYKRKLHLEDVPGWCQRERERGHTAVIFYRKNPTFRVRMMTLITPMAFVLDRLLTLGNWQATNTMHRFLQFIERRGYHRALKFFVRIITFHAYIEGLREGLAAEKDANHRSQGSGVQ